MATAIFHDIVAKDPELSNAGIEVKSAGTLDGITGHPTTDKARRVMQERGLDVTSHRAEEIRPRIIRALGLALGRRSVPPAPTWRHGVMPRADASTRAQLSYVVSLRLIVTSDIAKNRTVKTMTSASGHSRPISTSPPISALVR